MLDISIVKYFLLDISYNIVMENKFASRLKDLIDDSEKNLRQLSKETGISTASLSDWSNGKVQPTAENIYIIAKYFGVTSDYLLGLES